jgi:xyloglucan fucosyltransferase
MTTTNGRHWLLVVIIASLGLAICILSKPVAIWGDPGAPLKTESWQSLTEWEVRLEHNVQSWIQRVSEKANGDDRTAKTEDAQFASTCRHMQEAHLYGPARRELSTPQFQRALKSYMKLHRACTNLELNNLTQIYKDREEPFCQYLIWYSGETAGLGNKIINLVPSFLFAVLTQRVLLLHHDLRHSILTNLFCEPFQGSSWRLPADFPVYEEAASRNENEEGKQRVWTLWGGDSSVSAQDSFYCPDKQEQVAQVKFLMTIGNTGWMPGLYFNPNFRPLLETWFPSDNPFYHAAHSLLHPNNQVWGKIKSAYDEVFREADVRVGLQIRHLEGGFYAPVVKQVKILHADGVSL